MDQEKFGQFIKEIRKKNNLTQQQFADKYHVTYQAVSKWENGKNMPDKSLIKQISEDFNVSLEELFDGEYKNKTTTPKNNILTITLSFVAFILMCVAIFLLVKPKEESFEFKTLSSNNKLFNVSGNIAYNKNKSSIYITNIQYNGDDLQIYESIECLLKEQNGDVEKTIASYQKEEDNKTIKDYLENVTLTVDDYEKICTYYEENTLRLVINVKDSNSKITTYQIPLNLESCS